MNRFFKYGVIAIIPALSACLPTVSEPIWTQEIGDKPAEWLRHVNDETFVRYFYPDDQYVYKAQHHRYSDGAPVGDASTHDPALNGGIVLIPESSDLFSVKVSTTGARITKMDAKFNTIWSLNETDLSKWTGVNLNIASVDILPSKNGESVLATTGYRITKLNDRGEVVGSVDFAGVNQGRFLPRIWTDDSQSMVLVQTKDNYTVLDEYLNPINQFQSQTLGDLYIHLHGGYIYHAPRPFSYDTQGGDNSRFCKLEPTGNPVWCKINVIDNPAGEYHFNHGKIYAIDFEPHISVTQFDHDGEITWSKELLYTNGVMYRKVNDDGVFLGLSGPRNEARNQDSYGKYITRDKSPSFKHITPSGVVKRTLPLEKAEVTIRVDYPQDPSAYYSADVIEFMDAHLYHNDQYLLSYRKSGSGRFENGTVIEDVASHAQLGLFE